MFFYAGDEWKSDQGKVVFIVRSLYGLKCSALVWRNHLSYILGNHLGFQSSLADPRIWFKAAINKAGNECYTYIIVYVDDLLIFDKDPRNYMAMLESKYMVKPSIIGYPKVYLVSDIVKVLYGDGSYSWTMSSDSYVKEAIKNANNRIKEDGMEYNKKFYDVNYLPENPFSLVDHRP